MSSDVIYFVHDAYRCTEAYLRVDKRCRSVTTVISNGIYIYVYMLYFAGVLFISIDKIAHNNVAPVF